MGDPSGPGSRPTDRAPAGLDHSASIPIARGRLLECKFCGSREVATKYEAIWELGPYGNQVRVDEWFERSCRQCKGEWTETIAEAFALAAQGIEARRAETSEAQAPSIDESPVPERNAP